MFKTRFICMIFALILMGVGCGFKEGAIQKESRAYLWFTGNTAQSLVIIDDLAPFYLKKRQPKQIHYEVTPGKHRVVVQKNGVKLVERVILLGNGAVKEINIP